MKSAGILCSLALVAFSTSLQAGPPEDFRYRYEVIGTDLNRPMQMEMAPDGKIYFNELDGKLRLLDPASGRIKTVGELKVFTQQESGFLGFALDPKFPENGHIFIQHSLVDYDGEAISRFVIKDEQLDLESRKELLRWPVQRRECCHHAGAIRFGPEGNLFISTGDNTSPFQSSGFTPIDEREDRGPFDAQKSSANTNDLRGKILRIKPTADGGYTIPEGNLFKPGTEKTRPEIYAMGFRNPWRFNIDPKTGILYVGDVGPDSGKTDEARGPNGFDTINQIREPGYFGWPYSRGGEVYREFDFAAEKSGEAYSNEAPINDSPNNTGLRELPPVTSPMVWYPSKETEQFPEVGTGGRTACGGPVFHYEASFAETDGFPEYYDGSVLIYDWQRPFLLWARLDKDSNFQKLERFSESARIAQGEPDESKRFQMKRVVDAFFGPKDGCLYVMDYGETWGVNKDAQIVKVSYQRGNLDPLPDIKLSTNNGKTPLTVSMSAGEAFDPEGKELKYEWILQPEGRVIGNTEVAETTIEKTGNFVVELKVTDPDGGEASTTLPVTAGNSAPKLTFLEPQDGDFFDFGKKFTYKVRVEDAENGVSDNESTAAQFSAMTIVSSEWFDDKDTKAEAAVGMTLMKQSDCFNCHAVETKIVGPSLIEIANRYRGQEGALDMAADRVLKGSAGVWGEIPMLPHAQLTKDEIFKMVEWIFELKPGQAGLGVVRGLTGELTAPGANKTRKGVLQASFTDFGNGEAGPLVGTATVKLRSRKVEAEHADEINGPKIAGNNEASGKKVIGSIGPGMTVKFENVNFADVSSLTIRYASPSEGRIIQFREGSPTGELIGEMALPSTADWGKYTETRADLKPTQKRGDLFFVFNGATNLDWIQFNP